MTEENRLLALEKDTMQLRQDLAVHLTDCVGRHKALNLKVGEIDTALLTHIESTGKFRTTMIESIAKIETRMLIGFLGVIVAQALTPPEILKFLLTLLKGLF